MNDNFTIFFIISKINTTKMDILILEEILGRRDNLGGQFISRVRVKRKMKCKRNLALEGCKHN
jgi:predicted Zn-dependent peptidase